MGETKTNLTGNIPARIVTGCTPSYISLLIRIFNTSLETGFL